MFLLVCEGFIKDWLTLQIASFIVSIFAAEHSLSALHVP